MLWEAEGGADACAGGRATAPPSSPRHLSATTPPPHGSDSRGPLPGAGARTDGRLTRQQRSLIASRLRGHAGTLRRVWPFAQKRDALSPAACVTACAGIQKVISSFEFENSISSTRICNEFRFFDSRLTSLPESTANSADSRRKDDRDFLFHLFQDILEIHCEENDIDKIIHLGRRLDEIDRPVLVEFKNRTTKNQIMESLSKLKSAEERFRRLSVTHHMTLRERVQCKQLMSEAKDKE